MVSYEILTPKDHARQVYKLLKSDRDVLEGTSGFTGEGKSTYQTSIQKAFGEVSGTGWDFDRMTWDRKELLTWINGKPHTKPDPETGLREGQLPRYSAILPDELFHMFYRRNWFDSDQINSIATFNMWRDRRLYVGGNIPNFWDLDGALQSRVRFYSYVPERGVAWVFEQENNPFSRDPWNSTENRKIFRKHGNPYQCSNFLYAVHFPDWDKEEKKSYYKIRNEKRIIAVQNPQKAENYKKIKFQRDTMIKYALDLNPKLTLKALGNMIHMSAEGVRLAKLGINEEQESNIK